MIASRKTPCPGLKIKVVLLRFFSALIIRDGYKKKEVHRNTGTDAGLFLKRIVSTILTLK